MTNISNFSQQIQEYKDQLTTFTQQTKDEEKLGKLKRATKDEQNKEKGEVAKAKDKGSSKPLPSGERAVVAALAIAMEANMERMGSSANSMQNQETTIDEQEAKINALDQERSDLSSLSPQDAMEKGIELNAETTAINNTDASLETSMKLSGSVLSFASGMNNTESGTAQSVISKLVRLEQTRA